MEHDVEGVIRADRYERRDGRLTWRDGYRDRKLRTRLGVLNLRVPKLRQGAYFPGFLEPHRTSENALVAVIQRPGSAAPRRRRQVFPNEDAIIRLIGALLFEQNDDWLGQHRYRQVEAFAQIDAAQTDSLLSSAAQAA